ncbi:CHASE2 domain-containing protein [Novosphingobium sp.]|uniref:CHASE2 domain-containing protein n=1 Tax=Novosphingobium sp. TaxID=1874826 RepID=UPI0026107D36|nr:CHASE2 domain-containing protein [Novosphingobium sp.]
MLHRRLYGEWFVVAIVACLLAWVATANQRLAPLDNRIYDRGLGLITPPVDDRILIVEIDEPSLKALGRWPWPRSEHVRLLASLARQKPAAVGYSVLFLDESEDDEQLARAMQAAAPVYLAALVDRDAAGAVTGVQTPADVLASAAAGFGAVELDPDFDGVIRSMPRRAAGAGVALLPLGAQLAQAAEATVPAAREGSRIRYAKRGDFRRISFASLAAGEVPPVLIRNKLLLVGATAPGLGNQQPVPGPAGGLLSGVEIEANVLNTSLQGAAIATLSGGEAGGFAILPIIVLMIGFLRLSPSKGFWLAMALGVAALIVCAALLAFAGLWWPPAGTLAGLVAAHVLWGWRRLTVIGRFLLARTRQLQREPGLALVANHERRKGDSISRDADRLADLIEQLRALRAFVSEAVECLPAAICVADRDGRIVLCNRAAEALFGAGFGGGLTGQPMSGAAAILSPVPEGDNGLLRDDAGRFFLFSTAELSGDFQIYSYADVTDLQRIAEERDDILQFLSHDIRSPNAAIVTLLETDALAGKREAMAVPPAATIEAIRRHARHALRLADDFVQLARARRRSMEPEPLDLCDVAREAADMVWPRAHGRQITVQDDCVTGEVWVMGDRSMILRGALNLLENAVKFAPEGATVRYSVEAAGSLASLVVAGPGPAMPAGRAANPFALYAEGRAADGTGSLGLGLAFVQTMAQRHSGRVTYGYQDGVGGEFRVDLPLAEAEEDAGPSPALIGA